MLGLAKALKADFKEAQGRDGVTAPMVANAYGKSPTSAWPYELQNGHAPFDLTMVRTWVDLTGARNFMRWIGGVCRHVVFPLADLPAGKHTASAVREFGEYLETVGEATSDGVITPEEFARLESEGQEAMGAIWASIEYYRAQVSSVQHRPMVPPHGERF